MLALALLANLGINISELLKDTVRNFKRMSNRRVQFTLRINPRTPHQDVAALPPVLKDIVGRQDKVRFDRAT